MLIWVWACMKHQDQRVDNWWGSYCLKQETLWGQDVIRLPEILREQNKQKDDPRWKLSCMCSALPACTTQVVQNERTLRDDLVRDGLNPKPGYVLARYNDPGTIPSLRRNEVLIELDGFTFPWIQELKKKMCKKLFSEVFEWDFKVHDSWVVDSESL